MIVPLALGAQFAFWMLMPVMILGALGTILAKKPVHSALSLAAVMLSLAVQYAAQQAPFLFAVQIIVYTGAILMLFLFVMMIVGVDTSESLVETIKGQRVLAILAGVGFFVLLIFAVGNAVVGQPSGLAQANTAHGGNVQGLAALIFGRYVIAFEATSALLITAALGAMVLAHRERLSKKKTQADLVGDRMQAYAQTGAHPGAMPPPGVYARHNAVDTPALLASGEVAEASVSSTLKARGVVQNPADLIAPTQATVKAIAPERADQPATAVASFVEHATPSHDAAGQRVLRQAQDPAQGRAQDPAQGRAQDPEGQASEEGDE
ncbi:NADH-quinone oxidoreductase subunit J [Microlunatus soli]|uniref:NADH-quinone oxidoreductase subunit J n=1 Tax=Microlunatus soli TaxID=630515 RepID=A0A1H1W1Y7_9ACTN|nr:NADH-quinone oxidoreductase subunit J [Microlunatus soli]SDS91035.1 NADH dehydrogenase subunit J [Microlunatus soli]